MSKLNDRPELLEADLAAFDLKQLRHFLAIVEQGHFGRAAQQLGISKQGISQSVATLEESLGVRLFERGQFGAVPTEFGRVLTQYAKVIQSEARKARTEIDGLRAEHRGELTIAFGSSFSEYIAPTAMRRFLDANPRVVLKIANVHPDNMLALLAQGELDFVAMGEPANVDLADLQRIPLFRMRSDLLLAASHPLAAFATLELTNLASETFVGVWRNDITGRTIAGAFAAHGIASPRVIECDNPLVSRGLLLDEHCLVIANRLFFGREIDSGLVVERRVPALTFEYTYSLFHRKDTIIGRATLALMDELRRVTQERFADSLLPVAP
ncbi:MAG: LysR family transcriptional regulator [Steroidobacteraceae bacterium]